MRNTPLGPGAKSLERGSTFKTPTARKPRRRRAISPASEAQRKKARLAEFCVGCGQERTAYVMLDPAHLWPRGRGGCDDPLCVVPLCRRGDGSGCHRKLDDGELYLLPMLEPHWRKEVAHAVLHGGLIGVVKRVWPRFHDIERAANDLERSP